MKILELTNYSAGICGVWTRVREEALRLAKKGHEVKVFSSNFVKGGDKIATAEERVGEIEIKRFPAWKLGGESFMKWDFYKEALDFKPDLIIAHSYRHSHTKKAVGIAQKIGARVFLVTHAPFVEDDITRGFFGKLSVKFYDWFIGPGLLSKFDKVIAITKWEIPHLLKLGVQRDKIEYVPNGIPEEFFRLGTLSKEERKILFLGRVSPVKDLEVLIKAMTFVDGRFNLEIVGPAEEQYREQLERLVRDLELEDRVKFSPAIYDLKEKIRKIDSASVFVLPSKSEAMPQALIEAMARSKVVVASDNRGAKDLVEEGKNGFLFRRGDFRELAEKIKLALAGDNNKIKIAAKRSVEKFNWDNVIKEIERLL